MRKHLMESRIKYEFSADVWRYSASASWFFVALPTAISAEIKEHLKWQEEGWGRMKAKAQVGQSVWDTAIWYDRKRQAYLLPLKATVRKKEAIEEGAMVSVSLWL